jgi:hypothetical protein
LLLLALGLRKDASELGSLVTFAPSFGEALLAATLIWMAARESTASKQLPRWGVWSGLVCACIAVVGLTLWTYLASPALVLPVKSAQLADLLCGSGATVAGAVVLAAVWLLFRRTLAVRPAFAGALYGIGAGVAVNAGLRMACRISEPWHALGAHGLAIVATGFLGAMIAKRSVK